MKKNIEDFLALPLQPGIKNAILYGNALNLLRECGAVPI
jgi:hypothetical protein